jgi:hypothetical protein
MDEALPDEQLDPVTGGAKLPNELGQTIGNIAGGLGKLLPFSAQPVDPKPTWPPKQP